MKEKLLLVFFTINCFAQAPAIDWQKCYGGSSKDIGFSVQETFDNGYVFAGQTSSNDAQVTNNYGNIDVWVVKTNSLGTIEWEKTFGGSNEDYAHYIEQTSDGGYILTGTTLSNDGDFTDNHGLRDIFAIKLNNFGIIEWKKCLGGISREYGEEIHQTTDNGYIIFGRTNSESGDVETTYGNIDFWLIKLNSNGDIIWENNYGGNYDDIGLSVKETQDNGYILSGYTNSVDGDSLGNHSFEYDCLVIKTDDQGGIEWKKVIGGVNDDYCYSIIEDGAGNFIGTGYTNSIDGDIQTNIGGYDGLVFKLNSIGDLVWSNTFGSIQNDALTDISLTLNGDFIVSGVYDGFIDTSSNSQSWLIKFNSSGDLIWENKYGGSNDDAFIRSSFTASNDIICIGQTNSNDIDVTENHGDYDFWIVKLSPEQLSNSTFQQLEMNISPNPASHYINLHLSKDYIVDEIKIIDVTGKLIVNEIKNANQIDISNLSKGLYFIEVFSKNNKYQSKFIKQ